MGAVVAVEGLWEGTEGGRESEEGMKGVVSRARERMRLIMCLANPSFSSTSSCRHDATYR